MRAGFSNKAGVFLAAAVPAAVALVLFTSCSDKTRIGPVEEVTLLPWEIRLPARVDTGAATSSLYVRDVVVTGSTVRFRFPRKLGGEKVSLPLVDLRVVKSSGGIEEKRAVVDVKIRLAGSVFTTQVTLDDRSRMSYPMLIGRRTLKGRYIVDVGGSAPEALEPEENGD